MINALRIHPDDSVAVALRDLAPGTVLTFAQDGTAPLVTTCEAVPFGHKVALLPISPGEHVIKYGASIGLASLQIAVGAHVHVHNLRSVRGVVSP